MDGFIDQASNAPTQLRVRGAEAESLGGQGAPVLRLLLLPWEDQLCEWRGLERGSSSVCRCSGATMVKLIEHRAGTW